MAANPQHILSYDEYLTLEREGGARHEYFNGEVFAMSGAEPAHVDIVSNTISALMSGLKERPCKVHNPDMRVLTASRLSTYPDISVVCGERQFNDDRPRALLNPTVIIEVLSLSSAAYERGDKFHHYRSIATLREYVLIASTRRRIEVFTRQPGDSWQITVLDDAGAVELASIGCALALPDVYDGVEFDAG